MTILEAPVSAGISGRRWPAGASVFAATIFLSAALLFWLEPLFAKMVLPVLGGSAAVWSTALVVFQGLLLAGYLYAHLLTRLARVKQAALIHLGILLAAAACLPIAIAQAFHSPPDEGVSLWLMGLFLASIGLPFFAVAANAPLLQAWFAQSDNKRAANPYFLYRTSNVGSFAVLLAYPFLIEPALGLSVQSRLWTLSYAVLVLGIVACAALALSRPAVAPPAIVHAAVRWRDRFAWLGLGFIPSGLLVAVTAHIVTDVASAPFLWLVPLALYLLTFVFAFTDKPILALKTMLALQPVTIAALAVLFVWTVDIPWTISLPCHLLAFFVAAMICHTQLYRRRPEAAQLTQFYVWMSLGGVLGGCFAALLAPQLFPTVAEYPLLALVALAVRPNVLGTPRKEWLRDGAFVLFLTVALIATFFFLAPALRLGYFQCATTVIALVIALQGRSPARLIGLTAILFLVTDLYYPSESTVLRARSFYGAYKVVDLRGGQFRALYNGTTTHGAERLRDDNGAAVSGRPEPITYYHRSGPIGQAVGAARARAGGTLKRVGVIGLGMGALACSATPGEAWTFYELDPLVVRIAEDPALFRSMSMCAAQMTTIVGDGRLKLREAKAGFDVIVLDAFSSDSIPVHLLTREAIALYKAKLAPHGVIVVHISNRNVELKTIVAGAAAANGMVTAVKIGSNRHNDAMVYPADVAVVAPSAVDMAALHLDADWRALQPIAGARVWTDDYSDILEAMVQHLGE